MAEKKTGNKPGYFPASPDRTNRAKDVYRDDKFTILDIVKNVKSINPWDLSGSRQKGLEISDTIDEALVEKDPTAGGTYKGNVYYSNILPELQDKTPWSKKGATLVRTAAQQKAKKSDVLAVQNYFVDIGYMHPSEVDGYKGKQLMGMIRRWNLNAGQSKEAMFDAMDTWKDNIFDNEEDLREGGGDQGGY